MANPNNILKSFTTSDQNLINILQPCKMLLIHILSTAGLAIKGGGKVKAGTLAKAFIDGKLVSIGANTDMPALAGTVANGKFNVFVFSGLSRCFWHKWEQQEILWEKLFFQQFQTIMR